MTHSICTVDSCGKLHLARGYCGMHYRRFRCYGDPLGGSEFRKLGPERVCSVADCGRAHATAGLCSAHLARMKRHGSPTGGRGSASLGIAATVTPCTVDDCDAAAKAGGMCWSHFNKQRYLADPDLWARYASEYRARARGATVERFSSQEIFKRDRWCCGLCGKKIPKTLRHPDPRSASLDHIVPLSQGGEHSRRNTQAAHLLCNLRKGVRGEAQQLPLIG